MTAEKQGRARQRSVSDIKRDALENVLATSASGTPEPMFKATAEQERAVELFSTGDSLRLVGYAGAAKTSTLELIARSSRRRGIYLAFNRAIKDEARKRFPVTVRAQTTHALALAHVRGSYSQSKLFDTANANMAADALDIEDMVLGGALFTRRQIASCVLQAISRFCNGGVEQLKPGHVVLTGRFAERNRGKAATALSEHVFRLATQLWPMMLDEHHAFPLGHSGYLKLWSLARPRIPGDYILLDEAQDTNPCVIQALKAQDAQLVFVGDPSQQIYEWRGAVDAMRHIPAAQETYLSQSFRFGESLAGLANVCLGLLERKVPLQGNPKIATRLGACEPNAILARSNSGVIRAVLLSLLQEQRPYVVGGTADLINLLEAVSILKLGNPTTRPELFGYKDWEEVVEAVKDGVEPSLDVLVQLVEEHGEQELIAMLRRCPSNEPDADLVISTAHKAKGREWGAVELADDFRAPAVIKLDGEPLQHAIEKALQDLRVDELRLLYVAITRAKTALRLPVEIAEFFALFRRVTDSYWAGIR